MLYTAEAARTVAFEQDEEITQAKRKAEGSSESDSAASSSKATTPNKKAKQSPAGVASGKRTAEPSPSQAVQRPMKRQRTTEDASTPVGKPADQPAQASEPPTINTVQRLKPKPKQVRKDRKRRNQQQAATAAALSALQPGNRQARPNPCRPPQTRARPPKPTVPACCSQRVTPDATGITTVEQSASTLLLLLQSRAWRLITPVSSWLFSRLV